MFPQAYDDDHLVELVDSNSSSPEWVADADVLQRVEQYARSRAESRGEQSQLDSDERNCLITTNWNTFTDDWGFDNGSANQVAVGTYKHGAGDNADLFTDTAILQSSWLKTADGRKTQAEPYNDEEFEQSDEGDMWIPHNAQDYIAIIELTAELLHGSPDAADAM